MNASLTHGSPAAQITHNMNGVWGVIRPNYAGNSSSGVNAGMCISSMGVALIQQFEGLSLTPYYDSVGVLTIGYGHTQSVSPGMTITFAQARELLDQDIAAHATGIFKYIKVKLSQNQFDALASFHMNLGADILSGSALLTHINRKNWSAAANEMKRYVYAGRAVLEGLVKRRNAEAALFLEGNVEKNHVKGGKITMQCLYEKGTDLKYFDGVSTRRLTHPDEAKLLKDIYRANNGKELPYYGKDKWNANAPWYNRLEAVYPSVK